LISKSVKLNIPARIIFIKIDGVPANQRNTCIFYFFWKKRLKKLKSGKELFKFHF